MNGIKGKDNNDVSSNLETLNVEKSSELKDIRSLQNRGMMQRERERERERVLRAGV